MTLADSTPLCDQYSLNKLLIIWALSAMPMTFLAFVIVPRVAANTNWSPLLIYWIVVLIGLVWQFILSMIILKLDGNALNWRTVFTRL
jgi:uncharacterized protein